MSRKQGRRLSGKFPLAYMGVDPLSPFEFIVLDRDPTTDDYTFNLGDVVFNEVSEIVWMLVQKGNKVATWHDLGFYPFAAMDFPTDAGTATQSGGIIQMLGSGVLTTTGLSNTVTVGLTSGLDGQVLIGGGAAAAWANLTSSGGTVTITNGPNSINLEAIAVGGAGSLKGDTGTAVPDGSNQILITGDSNINTAGATNVVTTNLNNSITIPGPVILSALGAGVMQTDASGIVTSNNGTDGQVLIGGGTAPAWTDITSTGGTVGITGGTNTLDLAYTGGGGASVCAFLAYQDGDANSVTGDGSAGSWPSNKGTATTYTLGTQTAFASVFDVGGDLSLGGGGSPVTFTAPVTGKYQLMCQVHNTRTISSYYVTYYTDTGWWYNLAIVTTARTYTLDKFERIHIKYWTSLNEYMSNTMTVVADMTAGDTATYTVRIDCPSELGTKFESIKNDSSTNLQTYISGFLLA